MVLGSEVIQGSIKLALVFRHSPCRKTTLKMMLLLGKHIKTTKEGGVVSLKFFQLNPFCFSCV